MPLPSEKRGLTLLLVLLGTVVVTLMVVIMPYTCKGQNGGRFQPRMGIARAVILLIMFCCCYGVYLNYDMHCLASDTSTNDSKFCVFIHHKVSFFVLG